MKKQQLPMQAMRAAVIGSDENERTIEVQFATGAIVKRFPFFDDPFEEVLSLNEAHVRLSRLRKGAPFLNNHRTNDNSDVLGVVETASVDGEKGTATIRFSDREDVEPIFRDVKNKILQNVSVGYVIHKYKEITEDDSQKVKRLLAIDWEPFEISLVPIGADPDAHVRGATAESEKLYNFEFIQRNLEETKMSKKDKKLSIIPDGNHTHGADGARATDVNHDHTGPIQVEPVQIDEKALETAKADGLAAERNRVNDIMGAVRKAKLSVDFGASLIEAGHDISHARELIIDKLAEEKSQTVRPKVDVNEPGQKVETGIREAVENSLLNRFAPGKFELSDDGMQYRAMSLMELAKLVVKRAGFSIDGTRKEIAGRALHTTSDFPEILANVANKTLRAGYEESPQTFMPLVRRVNAVDFKEMSRVQLGEAPQLEKVNEHGEYKYGTMGEGAEKYSVLTYGKIMGITRQTIVNDDLDAFTRIPQLFGRAAANLESDLIWAIFTGNPNMGDGNPLFDALHSNLGTPAGLSITSLAEARKLMRLQTGLNGVNILNLIPRFLIVPAALETTAQQILATNLNHTPETVSTTNVFAGSMQQITEPRLDANSATAFYLSADPGQIDIIELATLDGQMGPTIETRMGFEVDGTEIKASMDVGVKAIDWRGLFKNAGA